MLKLKQDDFKKTKPFLKWPGGKFRIVDRIREQLPKGTELIEPFVGGGSVFLNIDFPSYILNDSNRDLIVLYQVLQKQGVDFIEFCRSFFISKNNTEKKYYSLRSQFNNGKDPLERSALFVYLNRHGYNGLCRYNTVKREFNVPFGRYKSPYFPEQEMMSFFKSAKKITFVCEDFRETLKRATKGSVVYCDPPYVPLSTTSNFTKYSPGGFSLEEQTLLAIEAKRLAKKGIPVLLSNHDTEFTRKIYEHAKITKFSVKRSISCKAAERREVFELLALF